MGNILNRLRVGSHNIQAQSSIYASIQTKNCTVIKCTHNIVKKSIKMVQDPTSPNIYYMNFHYYASTPVYITVYYCVKEMVEEATQLNKGFSNIKPENTSKPICYKCIGGENIEFPQKVSYIDISKHIEKDFTTYQDNCYPVVIKMEEVTESKSKYAMYLYGILVLNNQLYDFRLVKQKLEYDNRVYDISDIYGLDSTIFNKEWNVESDGDRECTICCTEKNDTILLPCKHMCLCKDCSEQLKKDNRKCPICRNEIELCLTIDLNKKNKEKAIIGQRKLSEGNKIPSFDNQNQNINHENNNVIININSGLQNENIYLH